MSAVATADGRAGSRRSTIGSARIERLMKVKTHHQRGERNLGSQGRTARFELPHRHHVRQIDGDHVPDEDRSDCRVPSEARSDDGDVDPIARGSEEIPSPAERIGNKRNDVLSLDQKEHEVVREVIADCDRNQSKGEALRDLARRTTSSCGGTHHRGNQCVSAEEQQPEREKSGAPHRDQFEFAGAAEECADCASPASSIRACSEVRHRGRWRAVGARRPSSTARRSGRREDRRRMAARSIQAADQRSRFRRREAREGSEEDREHFAMPHPGRRGRTGSCRSR